MTNALHNKIFADYWFRFDRYEIKGGYIRPAQDAILTRYAPWENFGAPKGRISITQPYESLLHLAQEVDLEFAGGSIRASGSGEDRILEWCEKYGLLGLLLHRLEGVVMLNFECHPSAYPIAKATRFIKLSSGWEPRVQVTPAPETEPGAFLRKDVGNHEIRFEALDETWGGFFPGVPEHARNTYEYPLPFTPEFWQQYAEPVVEFINTAKALRQAVDIARRVGIRRSFPDEKLGSVVRAEALINAFAAPARPLLYPAAKGGYGFGYACHSLLAAYGMMIVLDLSSARLLECANSKCQNLFVTKAAGTKYCRPTCRGTVQMRKYRKNLERIRKGQRPKNGKE